MAVGMIAERDELFANILLPTKPQDDDDDDQTLQQQLGDPTLILKSEQDDHVLLSSRVLLREAYQRQGDNIITWCEPYVPEDNDTKKNNHHHLE